MISAVPILYRRIAVIAVIAIVALWVRHHYIEIGKQQGTQNTNVTHITSEEEQRQQEHAQFIEALTSAGDRAEEATARLRESEARAEQLANSLAQLKGQRDAVLAALQKVPDSGLHAHNAELLGGNSAQQGYSAEQERTISACLTELPICQQEREAATSNLGQMQVSIDELKRKVDAHEDAIRAYDSYSQALAAHYVDLWNSFPRRRNWLLTVVTFGIKGKPPKLKLPPPAEVIRTKPAQMGATSRESILLPQPERR